DDILADLPPPLPGDFNTEPDLGPVIETAATRPICSQEEVEGATCDSSGFQQPLIYSNTQCKTLPSGNTQIYQDGVLTDNPLFNPRIPNVCNDIASRCTDDQLGVIMRTADDCCQADITLPCEGGYFCADEDGMGHCRQPLSVELTESSDGKTTIEPPSIRSESIIRIETDTSLIDRALCSTTDNIDFSTLELSAPPSLETGTSSVIKQFTGFFMKITGKQTSPPPTERIYISEEETTKYSELANLELPYAGFGPPNDKYHARFLDISVGSALLKDAGYTRKILDEAVHSSEHLFTGGDGKLSIVTIASNYIISLGPINYQTIFSNSGTYAGKNVIGNPGAQFVSLESESKNPNDFVNLKFIYVHSRENKLFKIGREIYSVSMGSYLIPYPFNEDIDYQRVTDPENDPDLAPYYELALKVPIKSYKTGIDRHISAVFLNPSEGYYALRDLPPTDQNFETIEKSFELKHEAFTNKGSTVEYKMLPIANFNPRNDYGGFKSALYLVPKKNIIVMDDETTVARTFRKIPGAAHRPPIAGPNSNPSEGVKLDYYFEYFDKVTKNLIAMSAKEAKDARSIPERIEDWWDRQRFGQDTAREGVERANQNRANM
ncbi:MAG: hypothetical protein KKG75_02205, partial [Nanoarchaeota archaeon]|nr:hypothetical protein [Nanoarchaeota archaeon]